MVQRDINLLTDELKAKVLAVLKDVNSQLPPDMKLEVFETLRTSKRQFELFKNGTSRTMKSKHLADENGKCHAADLVPMVRYRTDGTWQWTWAPRELPDGRSVWDLITSSAKAHGLTRIYFKTKKGKSLDGPHVQLD